MQRQLAVTIAIGEKNAQDGPNLFALLSRAADFTWDMKGYHLWGRVPQEWTIADEQTGNTATIRLEDRIS